MTPAAGIAVTGAAQACRIVVSFTSGIVLARLLSPEDFGLVALVAPAVALIGLVQDLGLNQSTIQRPNITQGQVNGLFWITFALSSALGTLLAVSGPALAAFFDEPRVVPLAMAFGGLVVVWSTQSQPMALLARRMHFGRMALIDVTAVLVGFAVGVAVALATRSHWALFASMLASGLTSTTAALIVSGYRPGRVDFAGQFNALVGFGSSVSAFNVFNFLSRNADNLLIGRIHGVVELGLYDRAYKLLLFPLQQVGNPLSRVMVPYLSRTLDDGERYRSGYLTCLTGLLALIQPAVLVAVLYADMVFLVLLGPDWLAAAPIFAWLGIAGLQQGMGTTLSWLFLSQGRGKDYLTLGAAQCVIILTAFAIGVSDGAVGVARAYAIADTFIRFPLACTIALKVGPVRLRDFLPCVLPHVIALGASAGMLLLLRSTEPPSSFLTLAGLTFTCYLAYGSVLLLWPSKRTMVAAALSNVSPRLRLGRYGLFVSR
ncbi:lipopolysaccharide biosynthesis protein [Acuticoccus sp.]|uniref:lipopolysaccharide biosynthesis protein n=1 Tax=Acuticoccus sp. TaxID=1904378 RepID=UPI003B52E72B